MDPKPLAACDRLPGARARGPCGRRFRRALTLRATHRDRAGSAPDIAGQGIANPIGTILSAALLLRHSLGLEAEAQAIEAAVARAIASGVRTADLAPQGHTGPLASTAQMGAAIREHLAGRDGRSRVLP